MGAVSVEQAGRDGALADPDDPMLDDARPSGLWRTRPVNAAAAVALSAVVVGILWLVHSDAVDSLRADQWDDIRLVQHSSNGSLSFGTLWAQHNENRMFFQNLLTVLLAHTVHYNVVFEDYLSAILLVLAMVVLVRAHRARSPSTPLIAYLPLAVLLLSVVQWGTVLFGFEVGWAMIMLGFAVALSMLDRPVLGKLSLAAAIAAAMVASFTSLQGLLIWPACLALLYQRGRPRRQIATWIAAGAVTTVLYFAGWSAGTGGANGGATFVRAHPFFSVEFYFVAVGDVIGMPISGNSHATDLLVGLFGVTIVAGALWTIALYGLRRDRSSASPLGVSLIWFGLLFAALITVARAKFGLMGAAESRYTTFDLLILAGIWLALAGRLWSVFSARRTRALAVLVVAAICVQVVLGTAEGLSAASGYRQVQLTDADIAANIGHAPDGLVVNFLGVDALPAGFVRRMARVARDERLSLFSTGAAAAYEKRGLIKDTSPPSTAVARPTSGAVLRGRQWLVASAGDLFGVTRVQFELSGAGGHETFIGTAARAPFGWLLPWNTSGVPDGTYVLSSLATAPSGLTGRSAGIIVTVRNGARTRGDQG